MIGNLVQGAVGALAGGGAAGGAGGGAGDAGGADFKGMLSDIKATYKEAQENNMALRKLTVEQGNNLKAAQAQVQAV